MPAVKRRRKSEDEILDLDYLANNSSLDGMLSHLKPELRNAYQDIGSSLPVFNPLDRVRLIESSPKSNSESIAERPNAPVQSDRPMGQPPGGLSVEHPHGRSNIGDTPMGQSPVGVSVESIHQPSAVSVTPVGLSTHPPVDPSIDRNAPKDQSTAVLSSEFPTRGAPDSVAPMGQSPIVLSVQPPTNCLASSDAPMGQQPMGFSSEPQTDFTVFSDTPMGQSQNYERRRPIQSAVPHPANTNESPDTVSPICEAELFDDPTAYPHQASDTTATYDIAGVGKRRIRRCRSVQDGHTNGEQVAYTAIWSHAKRYGHHEQSGSYVVDLSLSKFCDLISTDHKHARKLLDNLQAKLSIETARQPNFRLNSPTSYRVFNYSQILERRNAAGMIWVVRNRATQFIPTQEVEKRVSERPMGDTPMGLSNSPHDQPMGHSPEEPTGLRSDTPMGLRPTALLIKENTERNSLVTASSSKFPLLLDALRNHMGMVDDDAARKIIIGCITNCPDATDAEMALFAEQQARRIRGMKNLTNPVGLLIVQIPKCFKGEAFQQYRDSQRQRIAAEREERQDLARRVLANKNADAASITWARSVIES